MGTITAPYNFVPLNKYVYCPDWADQVSQDIPFSDGEDGYIEVTWRNVSPLCIRDASAERGNKDSYYSMHIKQSDGRRLYFLPGSSLRGMLRNTLSIMSFGKMVQYDDRFFGHREFDTKKSEGIAYQNAMEKAKVGWLHKVEQEDDKYVLYPCVGDLDKMRIEEVLKLYPEYDGKRTSWERNKYIQEKAGGKYFPVVWEGLRLFATGQMRNARDPKKGKQHELLIPEPNREKAFSSIDEAVKKFFTTYEPSPDFEKYKELLDSGTDIPVSYIQKGEEVVTIGLGRMFRYPYQYGVKDLVEKEQSPDGYKDKRDLSELIFGWVDEKSKSHMKGRVQIGNAFCTKTIKDKELPEPVGGVLGEPKPSFYPLYVKQTEGGPYKTYEDAEGIAGRKLYRIHEENSGVKLPQGNGNQSVMSHFIPIPAKQEFVMRINVHNLRKVEIGALLSAITFHETSGVYHNIGSAKGYGYGKLECQEEDVTLHGLASSDVCYYLKAFESAMDNFCQKHWKCSWMNNPSVIRLMAIMAEHDDPAVKMMLLQEYVDAKKNNWQPDSFFNEGKNANSVLKVEHEERLLRQNYPGWNDDMNKVLDYEKAEKWSEALALLDSVKRRVGKQKYSEISTYMSQVEEQIKARKKISDIIAELQKKIIDKSLPQEKKSLSDILNERFNGGPNMGGYKVKEWKICCSKVLSYKKKNAIDNLGEEDKQALEKVIRRLFQAPV